MEPKVAIILFLPSVIVKMGNKMKGVRAPLTILLFGGVASFCTYVFTENLSTAIIVAGITVILIFIVHPETKPFLWLFALGTAAVFGGVRVSYR